MLARRKGLCLSLATTLVVCLGLAVMHRGKGETRTSVASRVIAFCQPRPGSVCGFWVLFGNEGEGHYQNSDESVVNIVHEDETSIEVKSHVIGGPNYDLDVIYRGQKQGDHFAGTSVFTQPDGKTSDGTWEGGLATMTGAKAWEMAYLMHLGIDWFHELYFLTVGSAKMDARALTALGMVYEVGYGVPQDVVRARMLWELAAAKGRPEAANYIGKLYEEGWGVEKDQRKAMEWYKKSGVDQFVPPGFDPSPLSLELVLHQIASANYQKEVECLKDQACINKRTRRLNAQAWQDEVNRERERQGLDPVPFLDMGD